MRPVIYPVKRELDKLWFVYYKCPQSGKTIKKYGNMAKLPSVEERLAEAERIIKEEIGYVAPTIVDTGGELPRLVEKFFEYRCLGLRPKSIITYRTMVEAFCKWYRLEWRGDDEELIGLEFIRYLHGTGAGPTTRNNYRSFLKSLFEKIVDAGKLNANPFKQTQKVRERRKTKEWFRHEQIEQLRGGLLQHDPQLWLACRLMFYCFIRPGNEMQHLQVKDIDLAQKRICIKAEYSKSGQDDEFVMVPDHLLGELSDLCFYPKHFYLFGHNKVPGPKYLSKATLFRRHEKLLEDFNYPKGFVFYSWKNTGAIHMLMQGISILHISKLMRHRSLDYTREYFKGLGFEDFNTDISKMMPKI
jgi:integrase